LTIAGNNQLSTLAGLNVASHLSDISIADNPLISSLEPLSQVVAVDSFVVLDRMPAVTDLSGLRNLTTVGATGNLGTEILLYGLGINDLTGLGQLTFVPLLEVVVSPSLTSLGGLNPALAITCLNLESNPKLVDVSAIGSLQLQSIVSELVIWNNPVLPTCEAVWLANKTGHRIGQPNVQIGGNDDSGTCGP
jgi:hypothetical protein